MGSVPVLEADVVAAEGPAHVVGIAEIAEGKDSPDQGVIDAIRPKLKSAELGLES